jgi:hypothetical protein
MKSLLRAYVKQIVSEAMRFKPTGPEMMPISGPEADDDLAPHLRDDNPVTDDQGPVPAAAEPILRQVNDPYVRDGFRI